MEYLSKHVDSVVVIGAILASVLWMNGRFNEVDSRFSQLEKDVAIIKTVLVLKNIMPNDLCSDDATKTKK